MQKQEQKAGQTNLFSEMEKDVLSFWEKNKIFEKSVERKAPKGDYVFYDGPPFATGTPHYGHIVGSIMKDVVPRFWTMQGFKVERKWGWDCHGLPIENIVEKELGSKAKKDIEALGVEKFNELCRSKVLGYVDEWERVIRRLGRWADMKNAYKTMDLDYMESIWWVFKELYDKGLVYEGYRSMHICPRCETTLSQQEVAEGYKDIKDLSAIAKFELVDEPGTFVLAWTTTPWTLIGNVALAVGEKIDYVEIEEANVVKINSASEHGKYELPNNDKYIITKDIFVKDDQKLVPGDNLSQVYVYNGKNYRITRTIKSSDLIGKKYKPLFDYYFKDEKLENRKNGWKIYGANFVTTEDGTGVVHIAPAFGEDDMNLGKVENLPFIQHVGMDGVVKSEAKEFAGLNVKPAGDHMSTDIEIIKYLAYNNLLFSKEKYEHSYPHCWRCETPLINYATTSWFVSILKIKDKMLKTAKEINWSPAHIKEGRFGKWLEGARDWSISRQRFWASVMPIWVCDKCGEKKVFGSIEELDKNKVTKNKYYVMRHGETERVENGVLSSAKDKWPLTVKGIKIVEKSKAEVKKLNIDLIYASDVLRTRQTAEIIGKELGIKIIADSRLAEVNYGELEERSNKEKEIRNSLDKWYSDYEWKFPGGESLKELTERVFSFWQEIDNKYENKNILIVSHDDSIRSLQGKLLGFEKENIIKKLDSNGQGTIKELKQKTLDLHKHIVDKITFPCGCGGTMKRVPDVLDTWFDSGSMPYAQMHYPFENKEKFEKNFPAEFIAEGIDQTRAWFYYLHAIANGIKKTHAFNNVIVNGIVLAEDGKKMAKRLNNYPDPSFIFDKYGADALRYYLLTSPVMLAENLNFSEKGVQESLRNVIMTLWNVFKFYEMYAVETPQPPFNKGGSNVLDQWILARLNQLIREVTDNMNNYNLPKAARPIEEFINDFSTWYLRRSRERFKGDDESDKEAALATTKFVLLELVKIMAPFMPFMAENLWQKVSGNNFQDENKSVHLESWLSYTKASEGKSKEILEEMEVVRKIVELGLAKRDEAGIKVRQPLQQLTIHNLPAGRQGSQLTIKDTFLDLVKDEVNVKNVKIIKGKSELSVELDTEITPELKLEGVKRELVRFINNLRKDAGMTIKDRAVIYYETASTDVKNVFEKLGAEIMIDTLSDEIVRGVNKDIPQITTQKRDTDSHVGKKEVKVNGEEVVLSIKKI